jgi:hypothetical protein
MRNRFAALVLLVIPPVMNTLAAPVPEPYAILDCGPLPKTKRLQAVRNREIDGITSPHGLMVNGVCRDPVIRELPAVAALKDPRDWLAKNLYVTQENEGNHLRIMFRAGSRGEQVAILNSMLRTYLDRTARRLHDLEELLPHYEERAMNLFQATQMAQDAKSRDSFQKEWQATETLANEIRDEIVRLRRVDITRWAR